MRRSPTRTPTASARNWGRQPLRPTPIIRPNHEPERRCIGCGARSARARLIRFANVKGLVVPDPRATLPGRGAWLHAARDCWEAATARRAFNRAFKAPVSIPQDTVDFTHTWPRSASTS
ncbi:YlxR family protein [Candidatus Solirubrobacter pratensis]|uniref:YlxR family protein n=1 Tax=Candidatus Solirubrobacter pratensis TaxID=1298857 RepID=UPI0038993502